MPFFLKKKTKHQIIIILRQDRLCLGGVSHEKCMGGSGEGKDARNKLSIKKKKPSESTQLCRLLHPDIKPVSKLAWKWAWKGAGLLKSMHPIDVKPWSPRKERWEKLARWRDREREKNGACTLDYIWFCPSSPLRGDSGWGSPAQPNRNSKDESLKRGSLQVPQPVASASSFQSQVGWDWPPHLLKKLQPWALKAGHLRVFLNTISTSLSVSISI